MLARQDRLKLGLPHASLAQRDPYFLRYAVLLLLAAGLAVAGTEAGQRLREAFSLGQAAPLSVLSGLAEFGSHADGAQRVARACPQFVGGG